MFVLTLTSIHSCSLPHAQTLSYSHVHLYTSHFRLSHPCAHSLHTAPTAPLHTHITTFVSTLVPAPLCSLRSTCSCSHLLTSTLVHLSCLHFMSHPPLSYADSCNTNPVSQTHRIHIPHLTFTLTHINLCTHITPMFTPTSHTHASMLLRSHLLLHSLCHTSHTHNSLVCTLTRVHTHRHMHSHFHPHSCGCGCTPHAHTHTHTWL